MMPSTTRPLQLLLLLLLIYNVHATLELCDLTEDICDEFVDYSFSSWLSDTYGTALDFVGLRRGGGDHDDEESNMGDDSLNIMKYFGMESFSDDGGNQQAGLGDMGIEEDELDDFIKQTKAMADLMSGGGPNLSVDLEADLNLLNFFGTGQDKEIERGNTDGLVDGMDFESPEEFVKRAASMADFLTDGEHTDEEINILTDMLNEAVRVSKGVDVEEETVKSEKNGDFEYLPMSRLETGEVGDIQTIDLSDGRKTTIKTIAKRPPMFEIENFLTDEECDVIMNAAIKVGPVRSGVFVSKNVQDDGQQINTVRNSYSVGLNPSDLDVGFMHMIRKRISVITNIPLYVLEASEPLHVGHYKPGGYYSAHLDSNEASRQRVPCCFQKPCTDSEGKVMEAADCCTICRYGTFLYYLKDVEGGGETAFPYADLSMSQMLQHRESFPDWKNLTTHCHDANVVVKPAKGKAIFWYNHFLDNKGYLGGVDKRSYHGGCNVTEGSKWIATNWISSPVHAHRFTPSRHADVKQSYKSFVDSRIVQ